MRVAMAILHPHPRRPAIPPGGGMAQTARLEPLPFARSDGNGTCSLADKQHLDAVPPFPCHEPAAARAPYRCKRPTTRLFNFPANWLHRALSEAEAAHTMVH